MARRSIRIRRSYRRGASFPITERPRLTVHLTDTDGRPLCCNLRYSLVLLPQ